MEDSPRIQELRRRVDQNPASLAFAPLAEELRRSGRFDEAARVCRAGLQHHPEYVSARVTLGRVLADQGHDDEALAELSAVLERAPENLAALRGLADVLERQAGRPDALAPFERVLAVARQSPDPELQEVVARLQAAIAPASGLPPDPTPAVEDAPRARSVLARLETLLDAVLADRARRAAGYRS